MASQQYLDLCHDLHNRILTKLERRSSESLRFATRDTAESVLESHYLRLFFQSVIASDAPTAREITITEDEFVENVQSRRLHAFIAIIIFAACRVDAAVIFTAKLAAATEWPLPASRIRDNDSLPADRDSLREFFDGEETNADRFFGSQAVFCTVVLRQREETVVRDGDTQRLPYLEDRFLRSGSFGRVWKVRIAKGHIENRHAGTLSSKETWVARKDFIVESHASFKDEVEIMKMILAASKTCENILENLGTLRIDSPLGPGPAAYSLFMPLATCDLGAYMKKDNPTLKTAKMRAELIRSAMGLAAGLNFLHTELQTPDFEDVVCYHMDLKPSNILVFHEPGTNQTQEPRTVWKLSDFGMSRVKLRRRNQQQHEERDLRGWFRLRRRALDDAPTGTQNQRGQGTYLPSESFLSGKFMNEKSDVWSLGCVLSVFFAYLEGGSESVADYMSDRLKYRKQTDQGFDGFFWITSFGRVTLHRAVKTWHHRLAKRAGTRSTAERDVIHSMLSFLEDEALNLNQKRRCSAKRVEKALKEAMESYRILDRVQFTEPKPDEQVTNRPNKLLCFNWPRKAKALESIPSVDSSIQRWRLPREALGSMKYCKISPNGTVMVYWSDLRLMLFTSLTASLEDRGDTLRPADEFSLGDATFFWKAVSVTERYLVASTTGGTFNCYIFDLEGGASVDANLDTCYRVSLPFPEINNLAISPDHQTLVCVRQDGEDERFPGSLFHAKITELIELGERPTAETPERRPSPGNTPLNFPQPLDLTWPAEDVISMTLRSQSDGYLVIRPELMGNEVHTVSIVSFSLGTGIIKGVDLRPQGFESTTASLFTTFSELHHEAACVVVARERNLYKVEFPDTADGNGGTRELHRVIEKYRVLKVTINGSDDTLLALGTKRASHRIVLVEIKMPVSNMKDPIIVRELAQLPRLFDHDEFAIRLVGGDDNRYVVVAALVDMNRYAIHKIVLFGQAATPFSPSGGGSPVIPEGLASQR